MSEDEEFQFRARLERERAQAPQAPQIAPTASVAKPQPSFRGQLLDAASLLMPVVGPIRAGQKSMEALDRAGYEAGGKVTDAASRLGASPQTAAALGAGTNVAVGSVPMLVGGEAGKLASPSFQKGARSLMQSALKPSQFARKSGKAEEAVTTMLDKGVNVTEGGVEKLNAAIDKLDDELSRVIADSKARVGKIEVLKPMKEALDRFRKQATPNADLAEIRKAAKEFFNHPALRGKPDMPIQQAQDLKRGTYRALGDKSYGRGLKSDAERDAQKALAHGLQQGIEKGAPEAGAINAEMGPLINARNIAQERVLQAGNRDPLGFGALFDPGQWPVWIAQRSSLGQSLAARALNAGQTAIPASVGRGLGGVVGIEEERRPKK